MGFRARGLLLASWALFTAVAASCSSSSGTDEPSSPVVDAGTGAPPVATPVGTTGGVVTSSDNSVKVTIPSGALTTATTITITPSTSSIPGAIGTVYEIGPTGTQFATPVTITLTYKDTDLGAQPTSHFAVSTVANNAWAPIAASLVDPNAHVMSGQTSHLSPYAIAALPGQSTSTNDAGSSDDAGSTDGGSAPDSGSCTTCPVVLASGQDIPQSIAVDGTYVYWTNFGTTMGFGASNYDGAVMRVPIAGGTATAIAPTIETPQSIVIDGTNAYFSAAAPNPDGGAAMDWSSIYSVPLDGSSAPSILTTLSGVYHAPDSPQLDRLGDFVGGLFLYSGNLYWTTWNGYVDSMPVNGNTPNVLTLNGDFYNALARDIFVDGTGAYAGCTSNSSLCQIKYADGGVLDPLGFSVALGGGSATTSANLLGVQAMTGDATYLYFTTTDGFVERAPKNGSGNADVYAENQDTGGTQQPFLAGIAFDDTYLYWTNHNFGQIMRAKKDGSDDPIAIATNQLNANGIAVDANNVYWTTAIGLSGNSGGKVMKLAKP